MSSIRQSSSNPFPDNGYDAPVDPAAWLALVSLFLAGGLTPGPAVMLVVTCSIRYGFGHAMLAGLGVCASNLVWTSLAVLGAAALSRAFPTAFAVLKLGGLVFVVYLGTRLARGGAVDLSRREAPPRGQLFGSGLALQLANPNALVYFGGMLPAYIDPDRPALTQALIVMASVTVTELLGLAIYAASADTLARRFTSRGFAVGFFRIAALAMVASSAVGVYNTW
jgi:homoserine/homoserine lactone efflux protein